MKADKFTEAVGGIDENIIAQAINTDSAEKLEKLVRAEKMRKVRGCVKIVAAIAACICIAFTSATMMRDPSEERNFPGNVMISNPITYVDSYDEMEKYLGYSVPVLKEKTPESYVIFASDGRAESGKVQYSDGSELKTMRGSADISGIFGAKLLGDINISGVTVHYSSFESTVYSVWSIGGYSYCYSTHADKDASGVPNTAESDVYSVTEKIICILKGETK